MQACGELERPQDGAPAADIQAQQMGMGEGETVKLEQKSVHLCSGTVDVRKGRASFFLTSKKTFLFNR